MLDETIITETPPLYSCYGRIGEQVRVPPRGGHARRVLHGAINVRTGTALLDVTPGWQQQESQDFLVGVRLHWRGWNIVLFQDGAPQHTAPASEALAQLLGIEVRYLPRATPGLNAMDQLWRHAKREALADRPTEAIDRSARDVCTYIVGLSPRERLRRAGVLSGNFWLTK